MVFGLPGHKLKRNEYDLPTQTQPMIMLTPSLTNEEQRQNEVVKMKTHQQKLHLLQEQKLEIKESSLPLVSYGQSGIIREEPFRKRLPIKLDVSVKVVPKPKTKKSRKRNDENRI